MNNIKPLHDFVFVKRAEAEEKIGSIIVPQNAKDQPTRGTVLAVGPGRVLDNGNVVKPDVEKGQMIIFAKYGGQEFEHEGEKVLVVRAQDILAVLA